MHWFFFINVRTDTVAAIVMSDGLGPPLAPTFGHRTGGSATTSYWAIVDGDFLEEFLQDDYQVYRYDESAEGGDEIWTGELDPEDDLAWEIPPIQSWVKGDRPSKEYIVSVSNFVGMGSKFTFDDIATARSFSNNQAEEPENATSIEAEEWHVRCLWCEVPLEKRYNFHLHNWPLNQAENFEDFEDPLVWIDGVITERGQRESHDIFPNHYGDSVLECQKCGGAFLASHLEISHPSRLGYPGQENWQIPDDSLVLSGSCDKSAEIDSKETVWVVHASLERTLQFLAEAAAQSGRFNSWAEWTALQQAVNWLTHLDRNSKLNGELFEWEFRPTLVLAIKRFIEKTETIKVGTLGSLSPFRDLHNKEVSEENGHFWVHNFEIQERQPIANMSRISGEGLGWARPQHPALNESDLMNTGWSELDKWIALRGKLVTEVQQLGIKDWAIAIDMRGNLVS